MEVERNSLSNRRNDSFCIKLSDMTAIESIEVYDIWQKLFLARINSCIQRTLMEDRNSYFIILKGNVR